MQLMRIRLAAAVFSIFVLSAASAWGQIIVRPYVGFTLWVDCDERGAIFFQYNLGPDLRNIPSAAYRDYKLHPQLPDHCEPASTAAYSGNLGPPYERGHLVPINHLDSYPEAAADTAYMVNILPQTRVLNRGAWAETETIAECAREQASIMVIGGVVWGDNADDYHWAAEQRHAIGTPDGYWKALIRGNEAIAWLFDNSADPQVAGAGALDGRILTIAEIEELAMVPLVLSESLRTQRGDPDRWRSDCPPSVLS